MTEEFVFKAAQNNRTLIPRLTVRRNVFNFFDEKIDLCFKLYNKNQSVSFFGGQKLLRWALRVHGT